MRTIKIHNFIVKKEMCSLIRKSLAHTNYEISCTLCSDIETDVIDKIDENFDCVIIDKDIEPELKEKIKSKFKNIPRICLPSLDEDASEETDIKYISEPFKISELTKALDEIFNKVE
jgi:hypothetical protein